MKSTVKPDVIYAGERLRFYPNVETQILLTQLFGNQRYVWNSFLEMLETRRKNQKDDWKIFHESGKEKAPSWLYLPGESQLHKILTQFKQENEFLAESDSTALQTTLTDLTVAYNKAFRKEAGFPKFKSRHESYQAYTGKGKVQVKGKYYLQLPKLGIVKVSKTGRITGDIKRYTVSLDASGRYWISIIQALPKPQPKSKTGKAIGIDVGLANWLTLSDGSVIDAFDARQYESQVVQAHKTRDRRKNRAKHQMDLDRFHRVLIPRTLDDFSNYEKSKKTYGKAQDKLRQARLDRIHKVTTYLVETYDVIVIEDISVQDMVQSTESSTMRKHLYDASWTLFKNLLRYKCEWYGKELLEVNPAYTSRDCSSCGHRCESMPLHIRKWTCPSCGVVHDRDVNAAQNILQRGLITRGYSVGNLPW